MNEPETSTLFLLYGMYGAVNVGDELVCCAVAQGLRRAVSGCRLLVRSIRKERSLRFNPIPQADVAEGGGFHYTFWIHPCRSLMLFRKADAIVIGGGGLFQDQYGWRLTAGSLLAALMGLLQQKPVYVIGVGAGPLRRKWLRRLVGRVLSEVDGLCVRDQESRQELEDCGVPPERIAVTADVVFSMNIEQFCVPKPAGTPTAAFILREWEGVDQQAVAALLDGLAERGYQIQLHGFEPAQDQQFYEKITTHCRPAARQSFQWVIPRTLQESLETFQKADVVVSMRLHGCILACLCGIPLIPVLYERKVGAFARQTGLADWLQTPQSLNAALIPQIESARRYWAQNSAALQTSFNQLRQRSLQNFEQIKPQFSKQAITDRPQRKGNFRILFIELLSRALLGELFHIVELFYRGVRRITHVY